MSGLKLWASQEFRFLTVTGLKLVCEFEKYSMQKIFIDILGTSSKPTQEYKYLNGRCRHYKLIGESDHLTLYFYQFVRLSFRRNFATLI